MLANDGAGDHLGPHLLLACSGRQHSLTRSPFHSYLPLHAVPAQTSKTAGISLPLWRWTVLQWWFSNLHLGERNFKLTHYYLSSVASFSLKQAEKTNSAGRDYLAHTVLHMKTMKLWLTGSLSSTGLIAHWKSTNHCCLSRCALLKAKVSQVWNSFCTSDVLPQARHWINSISDETAVSALISATQTMNTDV